MKTTEERFWAKVAPPDAAGCRAWLAFRYPSGYGQFHWRGRDSCAHRYAYEMAHGVEIGPEVDVHHICENRWCVEPSHLAARDHATHLRDHADGRVACRRGHLRSIEGRRYRDPRGRWEWQCRACQREWAAAWRERNPGVNAQRVADHRKRSKH